MERPKKSCSCFGFFSKKVPKRIDEAVGTHQAVRSSLINFSSQFNADDFYLNSSLGSTQKLHGNGPMYNTLASPVCRTPSLFLFSGVNARESTANSGKCEKLLNEEETLQTRNSVPYRIEEDKRAQIAFQEENKKIFEEKMKFEEEQRPEVNFYSGLEEFVNKTGEKYKGNASEKIEEKEAVEKNVKGQEDIKNPEIFIEENIVYPGNGTVLKDINIKDNKKDIENEIKGVEKIDNKCDAKETEVKGVEKIEKNERMDKIIRNQKGENQAKNQEENKRETDINSKEKTDAKNLEENKGKIEKNYQKENLSEEDPKDHPIVICEIIENLDISTENAYNIKSPDLKSQEKLLFSKDPEIFQLFTENFQVESSIKKPDEPVFLKINQKKEDPEAPPDPEEDDLINPLNPEKPEKITSDFSHRNLSNPSKKAELFKDSIFIKEAAKKSFQNLVNRISSEKKLKNISDRLKLPTRRNTFLLYPESNRPLVNELKSPLSNKARFQNSQEILKKMNIRANVPSLDLNFNNNSLGNRLKIKTRDFQENSLSHSRSLSLQSSLAVNESKDILRKYMLSRKDSANMLPGSNKGIPSSSFYLISPVNPHKKLPSLKISPIKSILSADDYSDILSFLKNSPRGEVQAEKVDLKKSKLPALKPITPHYFYKKKSAIQMKQKARVLIEHL